MKPASPLITQLKNEAIEAAHRRSLVTGTPSVTMLVEVEFEVFGEIHGESGCELMNMID